MLSDKFVSGIRRLVPAACLLCSVNAAESGLCRECERSLPRLAPARCPTCAAPTPGSEVCGRCIDRAPRFDRVVAALAYAFPADSLITSLKYGRNLAAARPLAFALAQSIDREPYPDCVIAMPIARDRLAQRGFNQAVQIAHLACREFGLRISENVVRRLRSGVPQASLPWKERAKNVRGVFACNADFTSKSIAVVDDVLTAGATLNELAATLKKSGAREVVGWICARTVAGA